MRPNVGPDQDRFPPAVHRRFRFQSGIHPEIVQHSIGFQLQQIFCIALLCLPERTIQKPHIFEIARGFAAPLREWLRARKIEAFVDERTATMVGGNGSSQPREEMAAALWADVAKVYGLDDVAMPAWQIVKERRATFAALPAEEARRPVQVPDCRRRARRRAARVRRVWNIFLGVFLALRPLSVHVVGCSGMYGVNKKSRLEKHFT